MTGLPLTCLLIRLKIAYRIAQARTPNGFALVVLRLKEQIVFQNAKMGLKLEVKFVMLGLLLDVWLIAPELKLDILVMEKLLIFVPLYVATAESFPLKFVTMDLRTIWLLF